MLSGVMLSGPSQLDRKITGPEQGMFRVNSLTNRGLTNRDLTNRQPTIRFTFGPIQCFAARREVRR
jgi:hypothetical protein